MKKEVQEKIIIKPLKECLEIISQDLLQKLLDEALSITGEHQQKIKKKEINEYIISHQLAKYMTYIFFLSQNDLENIEEIINENKINDLCYYLTREKYIFKIDDIYYVPEELKKAYEDSKNDEINKGKINILITYYMISNGLLEVNKLIELVNGSGFSVTKEEIKKLAKTNNYKIKNNIIYLNPLAETQNEENELLEFKNLNEYKVVELDEALEMLMLIEETSNSELIEKFFKKKIKDKEKLSKLSKIIFNLILLDNNVQEMVQDVLEEYNIKLTDDEEDKLYDILEGIGYMLPLWPLNGYTPDELYCDEEDFDFNDLSDDEKKEIYILNYVQINGMISIDKLIEILTKEHNLKTNKKEIIKIVEKTDLNEELCIIENYVCYMKFSKEDFLSILSMKKLDKYKIIQDIEELIEELEENIYKFSYVCDKYNLNEEVRTDIRSTIQVGIFNEEVLELIFEEYKITMPLKKQNALYKDLKSIINNTRMWVLNGHTPLELNNTTKNKKIGRNEPCPCGSGKKYKNCCGR